MMSKKFFVAKNTVHDTEVNLQVSSDDLKSNKLQKLVTKLNNAGFNLGSGHDGMELSKLTNKFVLWLQPYTGAPPQIIVFKPISYK